MLQTNKSQVAALLNQITNEYIAAQRGLTGLAISATHEAINARMEHIGKLHEDLHGIVGDEAGTLVVECLEAIPES
jgi:hypothetical protein